MAKNFDELRAKMEPERRERNLAAAQFELDRLAEAEISDTGAKWRLIVDIFESKKYPVVTHIFTGTTRAEAQGYFDAHLDTDEFMRACVKLGKFGKLLCRHTTRWEELV